MIAMEPSSAIETSEGARIPMAHVWSLIEVDRDGDAKSEWRAETLAADLIDLGSGAPVACAQDACKKSPSPALLVRDRDTAADAWALLADDHVYLNGTRLFAGLAVLRDRDELQVRTAEGKRVRLFFSTERVAAIEPFAGSEQAMRCPRCRNPIEQGEPVVRCPSCNVIHHQAETRPCWTYARTCALCDATTTLDGSYRWTPEAL
jgi:uncharacterized C2H2 Zn-finger protein